MLYYVGRTFSDRIFCKLYADDAYKVSFPANVTEGLFCIGCVTNTNLKYVTFTERLNIKHFICFLIHFLRRTEH